MKHTRMAAFLVISAGTAALGQSMPLTDVDRAAGWKPLSGEGAAGAWRSFRGRGFPSKGWSVEGGELRHAAGGGGGDVVTVDQYRDAEFVFEFRTEAKANSGVMYRVTEEHGAPWMTGPEFQVLDDAGHGLPPDHPHAAGSMYDLYTAAAGKTLHPGGEWNRGRIRLRNGVVQHWLNGVKIVEATLFDDAGAPTAEWAAKIAGSKFKEYQGFGVRPAGHLALQDHGDAVAYRNMAARDLAAPMAGERSLFNGKDLSGWVAFVPEAKDKGIAPESVWRVEDGVLICTGNPVGYIRTDAKYTNFVLRLQWRFNPVTKQAGNSGVLVRVVGEDKVWPKSVEAQLHSGNAGDFWNIGDFVMTTDPARTKGRNTKKTHGAERPIGEWNEYEIVVNRGEVVLKVNGEELNRATGVEEVPGWIALQSEGAEIHFRDIRIVELK